MEPLADPPAPRATPIDWDKLIPHNRWVTLVQGVDFIQSRAKAADAIRTWARRRNLDASIHQDRRVSTNLAVLISTPAPSRLTKPER